MNPAIPKDVEKKVRRFVEAAEALKSGKATYFSITKLTSIKSLCNDPQTAAHFVLCLAEHTMQKAELKPSPSHLAAEDWEKCKELISEAVRAMRLHLEQPTEEALSILWKLLHKVQAVQTFSGEQVWGRAIRTINSSDVLIVEDALLCVLHPHAASELAYRTAKDYTEKYNPSYGTGLIPESVPMLEDIINFWTRLVERIESDHSLAEVSASTPKARKRRASTRKVRKVETTRTLKVKTTGSFEDRYPNVTDLVQNGWIEIGYSEGSRSFIRVFDEGGMVWEGKNTYSNLDEAFEDAEKGILAWLEENS